MDLANKKQNDMQKIMFNSKFGLEQAVLEGRKTMTRRSVSDKILNKYQDYLNWWNKQNGGFKVPEDEFYLCESPYKVNDVIAIAQRYCDVLHCANVPKGDEKGWNNKMFVKADLMPHHIKITGIKVERLQDISDEDCLKEGIGTFKSPYYFDPCYHLPITSEKVVYYNTSREAFAALIDKVSGKGTWKSNPWCFCYTFKLID